jgi:hypothetical protein
MKAGRDNEGLKGAWAAPRFVMSGISGQAKAQNR